MPAGALCIRLGRRGGLPLLFNRFVERHRTERHAAGGHARKSSGANFLGQPCSSGEGFDGVVEVVVGGFVTGHEASDAWQDMSQVEKIERSKPRLRLRKLQHKQSS